MSLMMIFEHGEYVCLLGFGIFLLEDFEV